MDAASVTKIADHAAQQTDRWLLIVILIVVFAGGIWLFRWMLDRFQKQSEITETRLERQTQLLEGLFREANASREKIAGVIADNTGHVVQCTEHIKDSTEILRRADSTLERACLMLDRLKG